MTLTGIRRKYPKIHVRPIIVTMAAAFSSRSISDISLTVDLMCCGKKINLC